MRYVDPHVGQDKRGPEPQAWVDCEECKHFENDLDMDPCWKCLVCELRCGFEEIGYDNRPCEDERGDCSGCQRDM